MALSKVALVKQRLADPSLALIPVAGGMGGYGRGLEMMKARNAGEAKWARAQARSFKDQNAKRQHMTKVAFKHNSQKRASTYPCHDISGRELTLTDFRDPLCQSFLQISSHRMTDCRSAIKRQVTRFTHIAGMLHERTPITGYSKLQVM
jgi:hypothetical protein